MNKTAKAHLHNLYEKNSHKLTPEAVVRDAKNPKSPLHKYFEWDDRKAAHLYRLTQAREMIATCIDVSTGGREFVYVPSKEVYVATRDAIKSAPLWKEVVDSFDREIAVLIESKKRTMAMAPRSLQLVFTSVEKSITKNVTRLKKAASKAA